MQNIMLEISINCLRSAYQAGQKALFEQRRSAAKKATALLNGGSSIDDEEEVLVNGFTLRKADQALYEAVILGDSISAHRQAFAVMTHHAWEKYVCDANNYPEYQCQKAYGELTKKGWAIERAGLELLRMVANCIKHDSKELIFARPDMFALEERSLRLAETEDRGMSDCLRLTNDHIESFFDTVRRSGMPTTGGEAHL